MPEDSIDRRGFIRIPFKTGVEIVAGAFTLRSDAEIDISMGGLRVSFAGAAPQAGTACRVSIVLQASEKRITIEASGKIVRVGPGSLAMEFTELDPESYQHLKQLILHNAKDPEKAEQEFIAHWGIRPRSS